MSHPLQSAWVRRAGAALAWRDGDPVGPVLEALALTVALEVTGLLGGVPARLRGDLRRVGQRALLHVGGELAVARDEEAEALGIAIALARDGLRALAGRPPEPVAEGPAPPPRDLARLLAGRAEPYDAASIARRVRASDRARRDVAWAIALARQEAVPALRLAADEAAPMRDPASGRRVAELVEPASGTLVAEVYRFADGAIAIYAADVVPVRIEALGVRTEAMQPGYWCGRKEGGAIEGTVHVGEHAFPIRVDLD